MYQGMMLDAALRAAHAAEETAAATKENAAATKLAMARMAEWV